MLLSEWTSQTNKTYIGTDHPDGKAHGILIRDRIKHHLLQATSVKVQMLMAAPLYNHLRTIHELLKFSLVSNQSNRGLQCQTYQLGMSPCDSQKEDNYTTLSLNWATNWSTFPPAPPSDPRKLPDLIHFAVTKNISSNLISARSPSDLLSHQSPDLITLSQSCDIIERKNLAQKKLA